MSWIKSAGFGAMLFAAMMLAGMMCLGVLRLTPKAAEKVLFPVLVIVVLALARWHGVADPSTGAKLGLLWLAVYAALDYLLIVRVVRQGQAAGYYGAWTLWFWYALILMIPALVGALGSVHDTKRTDPDSPAPSFRGESDHRRASRR